jgi:hypothetical protein
MLACMVGPCVHVGLLVLCSTPQDTYSKYVDESIDWASTKVRCTYCACRRVPVSGPSSQCPGCAQPPESSVFVKRRRSPVNAFTPCPALSTHPIFCTQQGDTDVRRGVCVALLSRGLLLGPGGQSNPELLRPLNRLDFLPLRVERCEVPLHMCSTQVRRLLHTWMHCYLLPSHSLFALRSASNSH